MTKKLGSAALALGLFLQPAAPFAAELMGPLELPATPEGGRVVLPERLGGAATLDPLALNVPGALANASASIVPLPGAASTTQTPAATAKAALSSTAGAIEGARAQDARSASADHTVGFVASQELFDGRPLSAAPITPSFDPPQGERQGPPNGGGNGDGGNGGERDDERNDSERPSLSFPQSVKSALLAVDPAKAIYGTVKTIRDTPKKKGERLNGSEKYWNAYQRGTEIDVVSGNENVFGRTTKITFAVTKTIRQMTKDDFKGIVPAFQLQMGVRELRQKLIERLDENRAFWHRSDPPVDLDTKVRVMKFQSYIDLYKEVHGADSVPEPEPVVEREPLKLKAEGKLEPLSRFPPRLIFLDVDSIKEPLSSQQLADMAELQRTGVYFVAFSRRPYNAPNGMRDLLVRNMSGSQLTAQMPNRFIAVTDDGAVISKMRKDGAVVPVDALRFAPGEYDVLLDAAHKALEELRVAPLSVAEPKQAPIFVAGQRFNPFKKEAEVEAREPQDPRIRYEAVFPRGTGAAVTAAWATSVERKLKAQGILVAITKTELEDGRVSMSVQKTDIKRSLERLYQALGDEFGMYTTPSKSDIVVISDDPVLRSVNPSLDLAKLTDIKGPALFENVLGLILGEARKGGKKGSASRMISFTGYRERYMSEFIIAQDAAEQNINFFSGHMVHAANDWLVSQLQHGTIPTPEQYERHLRDRWSRGLRETKPVGIPKGTRHERLLNASVRRGLQMYGHVVAAHQRGEILVGTEIPNFIVIETYKRGEDAKMKDRYIVHTIFDFIALRPNPDKPGHATLVTYDFKTGPAKSVQKLEKDDQVLTYSLFNYERWVGKPFPVPYLSGGSSVVIDDASIEFIYNLVQKPTITPYDREKQRARIPRVFDAIARTEAKLMGVTVDGRPVETRKEKGKKASVKAPKVKLDKTRPEAGSFDSLAIPQTVPGIKIKKEFAQQIVKGTKKIEYRTMPTQPKAVVAIIQTFTDEEPGRPAEVVGFARIEKVTKNGGQYEYHLTHVTPVKPYVVPNNKPGAIIWVKDVPVQGPKRLRS